MAESSEHKTVQAHVLQYAQEIGWTSVTCAEAEQQLGFALYPYTLPGNGAKEMMEQQLVAAQIQVHDLDVDEFCNTCCRNWGCCVTSQVGLHDLDLLGLEAAGAAVVNCTEIRR